MAQYIKDITFSPEEVLRAFDFKTIALGEPEPLHYADSYEAYEEAKRGLGKFARVYRGIEDNLKKRLEEKRIRERLKLSLH